MANLLTPKNLSANLKRKLQFANDEKVVISNTTVLNEVLSTSDGVNGRPPSATIFMYVIFWMVDKAGGTNETWPENWLELTVSELSDFIISKQPAA